MWRSKTVGFVIIKMIKKFFSAACVTLTAASLKLSATTFVELGATEIKADKLP